MDTLQSVEQVRFDASDGTELFGWLSAPTANKEVGSGDDVVIHVHGMSGNGFENPLVDTLRKYHNRNGRAFFSFNNRGAGVVTWLRRGSEEYLGGACFERFEACTDDIAGAISTTDERGYTHVALQGHSLGCTKAVHYVSTTRDSRVTQLVLLAPTDMYGWGHRKPEDIAFFDRATQLVADGNGGVLVAESCWDTGPLSAATYLDYATQLGAADIYRNGALRDIEIPLHIIYGTHDVGIREIDGSIHAWRSRVDEQLPRDREHVLVSIIDGAEHGFAAHLGQLEDATRSFFDGV